MKKYHITVNLECSACSFDEVQEECEVCGGEVHYEQNFNIPQEKVNEILADRGVLP